MIEHGRKEQGLGLDVGDLAKADFDRLGMTRPSLVWREHIGVRRGESALRVDPVERRSRGGRIRGISEVYPR